MSYGSTSTSYVPVRFHCLISQLGQVNKLSFEHFSPFNI